MLEKITGALSTVVRGISGKSTITEKNIEEAVEQIKLALLDADVNLRVVRRFVNSTIEEAKGEKVLKAVDPGQQFVKIIHDKIVAMLGSNKTDLQLKGTDTQSVILLAGLNGAGKTTLAQKLSYRILKSGRKPLLVACDLQRPAAIEQLKILSEQIKVSFYSENIKDPVTVAKNSFDYARQHGIDTIILDTAGRMQVDNALMQELVAIKDSTHPDEVLFVADAMTGQNAASIAKTFDEAIGLTGVVLTKFDSDTRGGAALSIRTVTNKPILFMGTGEKVEDLEIFYPDRIASRILGMGDIVSLVEKAQETIDKEDALKLQKKLARDNFTLGDMLEQIQRVSKMGNLQSVIEMLPGVAGQISDKDIDTSVIKSQEAIILSMTKKERDNYLIIGPSRRKRIAKGSGTSVALVNKLLKQYEKTRLMMKKLARNKGMQSKLMQQFGAK